MRATAPESPALTRRAQSEPSRARRATRARPAVTALIVVGAALLGAAAGIHLHLWLGGYRRVPTIGPLFLLQAVGGIALTGALLLWRKLVVLLAAALFQLATVGGLLLSVGVGLFGFRDSLSAPLAITSLVTELAGAAVLFGCSALVAVGRSSSFPLTG